MAGRRVTTSSAEGPPKTVALKRLSVQLKQNRNRAGKTQEQAGAYIERHWTFLSKVENGRAIPEAPQIRSLGRLYQMAENEIERLVELAKSARGAGLIEDISGIEQQISYLKDLEAEATGIESYAELMLPGLLQTEEAAGYIFDSLSDSSKKLRDRRLQYRLERQALVFDRPDPPDLRFLLCEASLRVRIGTLGTMERQMKHLRDLNERFNVEIRVWPEVLHPWMCGGFAVLRLPDEALPYVVYTEAIGEQRYRDDQEDVVRFRKVHSQLWRQGKDLRDSKW